MQFVSKFSKLILFVLITVLTVSCGEEEKPDNLLSEEKMEAILTDVHLLESEVNNLRITDTDSSLAIYLFLEAKLFKKHQIDTTIYRSSFRYYVGHPGEFVKIYKQVLKIAEANSVKEKKQMNDANLKPKVSSEQPLLEKSARKKLDSVKASLQVRFHSQSNVQKTMPVGK